MAEPQRQHCETLLLNSEDDDLDDDEDDEEDEEEGCQDENEVVEEGHISDDGTEHESAEPATSRREPANMIEILDHVGGCDWDSPQWTNLLSGKILQKHAIATEESIKNIRNSVERTEDRLHMLESSLLEMKKVEQEHFDAMMKQVFATWKDLGERITALEQKQTGSQIGTVTYNVNQMSCSSGVSTGGMAGGHIAHFAMPPMPPLPPGVPPS